MASGIAIGIASNLVSSAIYDLMKKLYRARQTIKRCEEERETLTSLLERMLPGVDEITKMLNDLQKRNPEFNSRPIRGWLKSLKIELDAASDTVSECFELTKLSLFKKHSLSKTMTAQIQNIGHFYSELTNFCVLFEMRLQMKEEPNAFWEWVKEKDDILSREEDTRRWEAAALHTGDASQHSSPYSNYSHHGQYAFTVDGSQHGYPEPASQYGYPEPASPYGYPESASPYGYPESASPYGYPESASPYGYPASASLHGYPVYANQQASSGYNNQEIPYIPPASSYSDSHYPPSAPTTYNPDPQYAPSAPNYNTYCYENQQYYS